MRRYTLTTGTFLLSFVPVSILLVGAFIAISAVVHDRVKQDLAESLHNLDLSLNRAGEDSARENAVLLSRLTDSAGLKASVNLLSESRGDASLARQAHETVARQLHEFAAEIPYDYFAISDGRGRTVSNLWRVDGILSEQPPVIPSGAGVESGALVEKDGMLYQIQSVPIRVQGETIGILSLGRPFDLRRIAAEGEAAVLRNGRISYASFPAATYPAFEKEFAKNCSRPEAGCEVAVGGKRYVVSRLHRQALGDEFQLLVFRSLDAPLNAFSHAVEPTIIEIALGGILFALLLTGATTRSVVQPLKGLASQLESGVASGSLPSRLDAGDSVREIELVAGAFNRVAEGERASRAALEHAKQGAEVANRLKTEFLNNISHELRTPVTGVLGMAELLRSTGLNDEQSEFADAISKCGSDLIALVNNVLDFSEIETGRMRLRREEVDLSRIIEDAAAVTQARIGSRPISVEVNVTALSGRRYIGDEKRIRQALMHLCENAVKYTEGGAIRIGLGCVDTDKSVAELSFYVQDTGIGISSQDLGTIFEAFTQVDGSLTRRQGGTGIGLSITRKIVELMGGSLTVQSVLGSGSTFRFTLPVRLQDVAMPCSAVPACSSVPEGVVAS